MTVSSKALRITLALLLFSCLNVPTTDAAVGFHMCEDEPCQIELSEPCSYYVEKSYLFGGSCCSLSTDNESCLLSVSDGNCKYLEGEPGKSLSCELATGETIDCFRHDHEVLPNVCRDHYNDAIVYDMTNFTSCSAIPSFTHIDVVSTSNESCPPTQFPLNPNATWTPSSLAVDPQLEMVEDVASSGSSVWHTAVWLKYMVIVGVMFFSVDLLL